MEGEEDRQLRIPFGQNQNAVLGPALSFNLESSSLMGVLPP